MREPLENEYFNWLCAKVLERNNQNYRALMSILHRTEFVWVVQEDSHRAADGIELRSDFLRETRTKKDRLWLSQPCSIFELLVAFAKRAEFQTRMSTKDWFWHFMTNLELNEFLRVHDEDLPLIDNILYNFIWRQYEPSGFGGLFPMSHTLKDQRKIELWYQFFEYIDDKGIA